VNEFKDRLRTYMDAQKLKATDLALLTGLTTSTIRSYLRGERMPSRNALENLAVALGASVDDLIGIDTPQEEHRAGLLKQLDDDYKALVNQLASATDYAERNSLLRRIDDVNKKMQTAQRLGRGRSFPVKFVPVLDQPPGEYAEDLDAFAVDTMAVPKRDMTDYVLIVQEDQPHLGIAKGDRVFLSRVMPPDEGVLVLALHEDGTHSFRYVVEELGNRLLRSPDPALPDIRTKRWSRRHIAGVVTGIQRNVPPLQ